MSLVFAFGDSSQAADWQQFRGGVSGKLDSIAHPLNWNADTNIKWSIPMKGTGWSSPVVVADSIFMSSAVPADGSRPKGMMAGVSSMGTYRSTKPVKHDFVVSCLSLKDGSEVWSKVVDQRVPPVMHPSNTYATESPATDGKHLFTFFANTGTLAAWDFSGNELWRQDVGTFKSGNGFGTGSSLAVTDGIVFLQNDNDESSFVAAYESSSGKQMWRDDRTTKTSWSTPLIWKTAHREELITCGSGVVTSYDPATGSVIWRLKGIQSSFSASPTIGDNKLYFGNSGPMSAGPLVAVAAGTTGEIQLDDQFKSKDVAWSRTKSGPGMASPVVSKGLLYIPGSRGILNCYEEATGERVYRTRVPKMATVAASLWADDERVFILDESGTTHVIQSGPEFKVITTNSLKDLFWSTPSIVGDTLLLRGVEKLYCVKK
ncbi:MAG: PQQ-binding-like beta-propeller repeat protein [Fuerstiella sp.]